MAPTGSQSFVQDPGRIHDLARNISSGKLSPIALLERYLARIGEVEPHVQAWRIVDETRARAEAATLAKEAKEGRLRGPLHGIPLAVKDIIDVEGLPTRCNSRSRENVAPATADAEIVLALRRQGALVLGKAHTTEFAFFDPSPARNPHNIAHTPGGSSSGSAAAVASGMAPMALGTQTVASVNRPAAYCGISAFKPSTRSTCIHGIAPLAASYDTVGFYGYSVDDAVTLYEAAAAPFASAQPNGNRKTLTIALPEDLHLEAAMPEMTAAWRAAGEALGKAGHKIISRRSTIDFARLFQIQRGTMLYEAARAYRYTQTLPAGQIGEKFLEAVRDGLATSTERYLAERAEIDRSRQSFLEANRDVDAFLWPAAPGTAPEGLAWTGDPRFIAPWTAIGGPIVTIPVATGANGLPLGVILAAAPGQDRAMTSMARHVAATIERVS